MFLATEARQAAGMGKVEVRIPLVTWRDGRPRFVPGPAHRALGYKGEDLRHGAQGEWYTLSEAIDWSQARAAEIEAKRAAIAAGETTPRKTVNATVRARAHGLFTVGQLLERFRDSPRMRGKEIVEGKKRRPPLSANTIRSYKGSIRLVENFDGGRIWNEAAAAVTGIALAGILDRIEIRHGLAQARAVRAMLSVAWGHGVRTRLVSVNPVSAMQETLPVLAPRLRPASVAEIEHLVAVADALGFPDLGDAVTMGVWTAQRQNDRLRLRESAVTADGILFAPSKKKRRDELLIIPMAAALARRLEAAAGRRRGWKVQPMTVLACERTRAAWKEDWYRKTYRVVCHVAATGAPDPEDHDAAKVLKERDVPALLAAASLAPMPSLADLRDQDLRDTCLSWLPLAGADKFEIAGFSGHAFGQSDRVLRHYVAVPPEFARRGMAKLEPWYAARLGDRRSVV